MKHACGCELEPLTPEERCDAHRFAPCHDKTNPLYEPDCPPCYRARLLSVALDRRATPTRKP